MNDKPMEDVQALSNIFDDGWNAGVEACMAWHMSESKRWDAKKGNEASVMAQRHYSYYQAHRRRLLLTGQIEEPCSEAVTT